MKVDMRWFVVAVSFFITGESQQLYAASPDPKWCSQQWEVETSKHEGQNSSVYEGFLGSWVAYAPMCAGSVVYEARLAMLYALLNEPGKAEVALLPVLDAKSDYKYLVDLALLQIYEARMESNAIGANHAKELEGKYLDYVAKYPSVPEGYAMLGAVQVAEKKYQDAINTLEKVLDSKINLLGVYMQLTMSYAEVGRYDDAIKFGDKAYAIDKTVNSNPYFAYAAAKALAGKGDIETAKTIIKVIAAKNPELINDPDFISAVSFIKEKINASNKTGN